MPSKTKVQPFTDITGERWMPAGHAQWVRLRDFALLRIGVDWVQIDGVYLDTPDPIEWLTFFGCRPEDLVDLSDRLFCQKRSRRMYQAFMDGWYAQQGGRRQACYPTSSDFAFDETRKIQKAWLKASTFTNNLGSA